MPRPTGFHPDIAANHILTSGSNLDSGDYLFGPGTPYQALHACASTTMCVSIRKSTERASKKAAMCEQTFNLARFACVCAA